MANPSTTWRSPFPELPQAAFPEGSVLTLNQLNAFTWFLFSAAFAVMLLGAGIGGRAGGGGVRVTTGRLSRTGPRH